MAGCTQQERVRYKSRVSEPLSSALSRSRYGRDDRYGRWVGVPAPMGGSVYQLECLLHLAPYKMGVVRVPILSTLHMGPGAMETTREGFRYQARKGDRWDCAKEFRSLASSEVHDSWRAA